MTKLKIAVMNADGTVLDSDEFEVSSETISDPLYLHSEAKAALHDLNWNRISNILSDDK